MLFLYTASLGSYSLTYHEAVQYCVHIRLTDKCHQPMDPGPCLQSLIRWYYDPETHTCRRFEYGGCEGNRNRFLTVDHCISECGVDTNVVVPMTPDYRIPTSTQPTTTTPVQEKPKGRPRPIIT